MSKARQRTLAEVCALLAEAIPNRYSELQDDPQIWPLVELYRSEYERLRIEAGSFSRASQMAYEATFNKAIVDSLTYSGHQNTYTREQLFAQLVWQARRHEEQMNQAADRIRNQRAEINRLHDALKTAQERAA